MTAPTFNDAQEMFDAIVARMAERTETIHNLEIEQNEDRERLKTVGEFLKVWRAAHGIKEATEAPLARIVPRIRLRIPQRPKNPDRNLVVDKAREIIRQFGAPVSRANLFDMLNNEGIKIYGKDPHMVLSTMLWRDKERIVRLGVNGYWLKELPYEPLSYDPADDDLIGVASTEPEGELADDADD